MREKPSVLGDALIHTVALARCTLGTSSVGNRLNGFGSTRQHDNTGLKPRCE